MHIVTKFLVVFAAVLSVLLAGLTIAYSSNATRIVAEMSQARSDAAAAEAAAQDANAQAGAQREAFEKDLAAANAEIGRLTQKISELETRAASLLAEANQLKLAASTHSAQVDQFTAVVKTATETNRVQAEELGRLRDRELGYARKEIELNDRNNDLSGQLDVATETIRALQEQVVSLTESLDRAQRSGGSTATASLSGADVTLRAPEGFMARVTGVNRQSDGSVLVSINAGSNDRLKPNMRLNIVRSSTFLATLVLERVDINESVGRVDFMGREGSIEIAQNDTVLPTL